MTPSKQVKELRKDFIDQINSLFEDEFDIQSIEFEPEENEIGIDPMLLNRDGVLTCIDEFGNDYEEKLDEMSIEVIALILTLIQGKKYTVSERI